MTVYWDVTSYSMTDRYRLFGERWYLSTILHDIAYQRTVIIDEKMIIYHGMKRFRRGICDGDPRQDTMLVFTSNDRGKPRSLIQDRP
jgi:hypothetical protein